ncbi:MAG: hypothetical protein A2504_03170 [Bdellovibrionales bacterium RIFOXYD12_FULL_39_22]|nr:MAG: hypothetical protein A2385_15580 [Bdellovibrionales bacterium RIFOXYB1_FULL_39_21]OFZ41529.1 MAG: hypothetical protein A2485_02270 [Bdellovibrionales bacterium RIFOXYC12_FULL_39_17]OFZ45842.1 MAG: hypothetical protein A2404_12635 [Bdellovibrionales bacterium RIFOXYC1_FULL_39_130]OFZ74773.1 MAG: hypothetical protein A2560_10065 [Bdellovibrionales bacterium RIFOXYD1_FULL_39_84]OFZ92634.1 MAG: hypothetical protein A2504_03170 [Bdellovibrionales bacterium RIFOXYD12_FULL_39_22]HLE11321.1 hy
MKNKGFFYQMFLGIFAIIFTLLFSSCAQTDAEKRRDAVVSAKIFLNSGECDDAVDVLNAAPYGDVDTDFLATYASAYACKASFNELTFFSEDLLSFNPDDYLSSMAAFSTSEDMTEPDDDDFDNLQVAINTLLYAGGISRTKDPTTERRAENFSTEDLKDIETQLFLMVMAQLGRYARYYGNADSIGVKGAGASSNKCFMDYSSAQTLDFTFTDGGPTGNDVTYAAAVAALNAASQIGSCDGIATGHARLTTVARACQGVVLLNVFLDLYEKIVTYFMGDSMDSLAALSSVIDAVLNVVTDPDMAEINSTMSQTKCMELYYDADNPTVIPEELQAYFLFRMEVLFR